MNTIIEVAKKHLETHLGVNLKLTVESGEDETIELDRLEFVRLIRKIEKLLDKETAIKKTFEIDLTTIAEGYWEVIRELIQMTYAEELVELIEWYLFERKDRMTGQIKPWEEIDGTEYTFDNPEDFYDTIIERFLLE
jgi:hypothetical protein